MTTRSEKVKEFTEQSLGITLPAHPRLMSSKEVYFVTRMMCEELMELLVTVLPKTDNVKQELCNIVIMSSPPLNYDYKKTETELMAEQVDALVDADYYAANAACKAGLNMDRVFTLVHDANMNKKFPDGTFHKNELGKIIKPQGWIEPNVTQEVERWVKEGSWC